MIAYFIMIGLPIIFAMTQPKARTLSEFRTKQRIITTMFFLAYCLMLALRHKTMGIDLSNYEFLFEKYRKSSWQTVLSIPMNQEPGFPILCKVISMFTKNFQFLIAINSMIIVLPIAFLYTKETENGLMTVALFLNMSLFVLFFSALRQGIAIALMCPIYYATKNKKLLLYFVLLFIGYLFHVSIVVALPFYLIYHMRINKNWLVAIVPALAICYVFSQQVFGFLVRFLDSRYVERYGELQVTGAYSMLVLFIVFLVYAFLIPDQNKMDDDTIGLRNVLVCSVIIQLFAPLNSVAMRMNYYYLLFTPLLIPKIANRASAQYRQVATTSRVVICVFFFVYFIFDGYRGADILRVFPYIPFWSV